MRAMKDSGVEWIGEIPDGWNVVRFKYAHLKTNVGIAVDKDFWSSDKSDTVFYTAGLNPINTSFKDFSQEILTTEDDLLLARNGTPYVYLPETGALYTDHIIRVKIKSGFSKTFIRYCLQQSIAAEIVETVSIATWSVPIWDRQLLPLPPPAEQQRIAAYLDEQCGEIDKVLTKTRESIEEYKKLKQSVITEAVTKGIRPDRPMKPSGIEWIGDIPEEWEVRPFRTILTERNEKNLPAKTEERLSLSIDLGVTKYAEKTTNLDRFKEDVTQYKLAYPGDLVMNSMNMIVGAVGVSPYFGCVSPAYYTYYDKSSSGVAARFCDFLFRTRIMRRVLRSLGKGIYSIERGDDRVNTCRLKVAREDLRALKIPLPSETEQTEIVAHLDQQCAEIDRLIAKKEQIITELESYKKSLIYECVTGKREVE